MVDDIMLGLSQDQALVLFEWLARPHGRWRAAGGVSRTRPRRTPKEDLLVGGLDDWAYAGWVLQTARLSGETNPSALRDIALALIADVLREGLMVAGDLVGNEHVRWHGEPEEWVERIRQEWLDEWGDDAPAPGAIVWLSNTQAGDEVARDVLARETGE